MVKNLGIIVHPFFIQHHMLRTGSRKIKSQLSSNPYLSNMVDYLQDRENTALLLEEQLSLDSTEVFIKKIKSEANITWIPTQNSSANPIESWEKLYSEIAKFNPESLILMGGYYTQVKNHTSPFAGCLADVENHLRKKGYNCSVDMKRTFS